MGNKACEAFQKVNCGVYPHLLNPHLPKRYAYILKTVDYHGNDPIAGFKSYVSMVLKEDFRKLADADARRIRRGRAKFINVHNKAEYMVVRMVFGKHMHRRTLDALTKLKKRRTVSHNSPQSAAIQRA